MLLSSFKNIKIPQRLKIGGGLDQKSSKAMCDLLLCHLSEVSIFLLLIQAGLLSHLQFIWTSIIFD